MLIDCWGNCSAELVSLRAIQIHIGTWNRYIGDDPRHPDLALDFRPSDSTFCFSTIFEKVGRVGVFLCILFPLVDFA